MCHRNEFCDWNYRHRFTDLNERKSNRYPVVVLPTCLLYNNRKTTFFLFCKNNKETKLTFSVVQFNPTKKKSNATALDYCINYYAVERNGVGFLYKTA